jgi:hypothetical protein
LKTLYSNTVSESIQYDEVAGASSKPFIKTQYYNDLTSTWDDFEDVISREISLSNENKRYLSFSFVPPSKQLSLVLDNSNQMYSTGSGDPKASILKKNLKIRCYTGYELLATGSYSTADDFSGKKYHTWLTGGSLYATITSYSGTISKYAFFNTYDRFTYGERNYAPSGYYQGFFEINSTAYDSFSNLVVTSNSNRIFERHKVGTGGWSPWYQLSNGVNTIGIDSDADSQRLEYILRWDIPVWGGTASVSDVTVNARRKGYMFERGVFLADDPEYGQSVTIRGRDYLKKGLETEINLPTFSNEPVRRAITKILDRCSIPYDTTSWDATTGVVSLSASLAENVGNISGWKALDYMMDAVNACDDDWLLRWDNDGKMVLAKVPTDVEADYVIDWRYNIEGIAKNFNADKQLQRITVLNKDTVPAVETLLRTLSGTGSSGSSSWSTGALFVRYVDNNGNLATETARSNTGVSFTFSDTGARDVDIYGCFPRNAVTNEVWGERGNALNITSNEGATYKLVNPFLSKSQCQALAEKLVDLWEEPQKNIELSMNPNPYLELIDNVMVFDRFTYTDDIYQIREVKESWNQGNLKDNISLVSRGFDLGAFEWDRNGLTAGINDLNYDKGFVFDQDLEIGGEDLVTYAKPTRAV